MTTMASSSADTALTFDATPSSPCRVCGHAGPHEHHTVHEMMFGSHERFDYTLCAQCGCLQIGAVPADLGRHYGPGYYSFGSAPPRGRLEAWLARARNRHLAGRFDPVGRLMAWRRPYLALASLRSLHLRLDARIVDVGCGGGELLQALRSAGFRDLLGVDPFIAADLDLGAGLRVLKAELAEFDRHGGGFDLVMFHHSLEHIPDPAAALRAAHAALRPGGRCIVRIPTVSSWAWREYGVHWCALDAPRHLALHSRRSIGVLAEAAGFAVQRIVCDSNGFQFWGSEQYRRGITLMRPGCQDITPAPGAFSAAELQGFERRAQALNRVDEGDQIAVYLTRRST